MVNISQCSGGEVQQGKYETSHLLQKIGVISGMDMTTEAALTKLMFLFGRALPLHKVKHAFQQSICGELTAA